MTNDIVKTFTDLVKIPSPSGKEREVTEYIKKYLKKINLDFEEDGAGKKVCGNSGNIIAIVGKGKPTIMFVCHTDTVEDGKIRVNPKIENGTIRSDGKTILGSDDKSGVAALLEALKEIKDKKNLPKVIAVFAVHEESPPMGAKYIGIREKPDFVFDVDGSDRPGIFINKSLGYINFQIHLYGKEAHAARNPEKGANAIRAAGIIISHLNLGADSKGTLNIGKVSGGNAMNVVPAYALIEGEARAYEKRDLEKKLSEIEKIIKKTCKICNCKYKFVKSWGVAEPPFPENKNAQIISIAKKASREAKVKFKLNTLRATIQANVLSEKGYNVLGMCRGGRNAHSKNENVSIKELEQAKNLIVKIIENSRN